MRHLIHQTIRFLEIRVIGRIEGATLTKENVVKDKFHEIENLIPIIGKFAERAIWLLKLLELYSS